MLLFVYGGWLTMFDIDDIDDDDDDDDDDDVVIW